MNRNGQTLVAFVIIVPVFIIFMAFVVDTGFILKEYTKLNSVTKTVLKTTYDKRMENNFKDQVIKLFDKNNISTKNIEITSNENKVIINNKYTIDSIFGQIIGLKFYKVKISMVANEVNGKVIIEKE